MVSLKFIKQISLCTSFISLSPWRHFKLKFNPAFHNRKYWKRQWCPCLTGAGGCLNKDTASLTFTILIGFLDRWKLAYSRKVREKMKALYLRYIKKKRKLFYLDFLLTPSYIKNITQVIDNTGILEDNFFVLSSRLKNHPPSYAASHLPWWGFGREPGGTWEQAGQRGSALSPQSWPALFATLLWGLLNISSTLNTLIIRLHTSLPHWALWCY